MLARSHISNLRLAFIFSLFVGLLGCWGDTTLSESDGKAAVDTLLAMRKDGGKAVNLRWFKKLDGVALDMFGQKTYQMKYEAEVEFIQDTDHYVCWGGGEGERWLPQFGGYGWGEPVKKGTVVKTHGTLDFKKTENGWHVERGNPC